MYRNSIKNQTQSKYYYILSCLDRDPYSKTYGCFDRLYWAWKLKDYGDLTLQRMVYPLTKMLNDNDALIEKYIPWIVASFDYISKKIHYDGSIDQAFYGEHSHAGTGFLLFDLLNTYEIICSRIDISTDSMIQNLLHKMASYLLEHDETHGFISNHLLGVSAALMGMYRLYGNQDYFEKAIYYTERVINVQSQDGWFPEYNGADPGYLSLAIYYLASIYKMNPSEKYKDALYKAIEFTSYFIHPDGSYGGEYGSRNTEIFYPGGYALMYHDLELAKEIIDFMSECIEAHYTVTLDSIDDGNLAPLLNNYLLLDQIKPTIHCPVKTLPFQKEFIKEFKDLGLLIHSNFKYYAITNLFKGGVVKSYSKSTGELLIDHCGFVWKHNNKIYTTQQPNKIDYIYSDNHIVADFFLYELHQPIPNTFNMILLKFCFLLIQKSYFFRELFKKNLAKMMINRKQSPYSILSVKIIFSEEEVKINLLNTSAIGEFKGFQKFSTTHMASSKYY